MVWDRRGVYIENRDNGVRIKRKDGRKSQIDLGERRRSGSRVSRGDNIFNI